MPKLAIYVSKQDMKSIERWRKRINFSRVFISAVFEEVRRLERTADAPDGKLAAAAEYYRGKMSEGASPMTDFGFELGTNQVLECKLSPDSIRRLLEVRNVGFDLDDEREAVEKSLADNVRKIERFAKEHGFTDESYPTWRDAAYQGYLDGVAGAWEKVCVKMRESAS